RDWSADVCSSDLVRFGRECTHGARKVLVAYVLYRATCSPALWVPCQTGGFASPPRGGFAFVSTIERICDLFAVQTVFRLRRSLVRGVSASRLLETQTSTAAVVDAERLQVTAFLTSSRTLSSVAASSELIVQATGCILAPSSRAGFTTSLNPNARYSLSGLM